MRRLIFLGDLIDLGPQSLAAIRREGCVLHNIKLKIANHLFYKDLYMKKIIFMLGFFVLSSCDTPELQAARSTCSSIWLGKIQTRLEQETYSQSRSREVATGQLICETVGFKTLCNPVMRTEYYNVPAVRTVDRNKERRDTRIKVCTQQSCLKSHGNVSCEGS